MEGRRYRNTEALRHDTIFSDDLLKHNLVPFVLFDGRFDRKIFSPIINEKFSRFRDFHTIREILALEKIDIEKAVYQ